MNTIFYHIYLTGNNRQDFCFQPLDFIHIINRLALAAYEKKVRILGIPQTTLWKKIGRPL